MRPIRHIAIVAVLTLLASQARGQTQDTPADRYNRFLLRWNAARDESGPNSDLPKASRATAARRLAPADVARAGRFNSRGPFNPAITQFKPGVYATFGNPVGSREGFPFHNSDVVVVASIASTTVGLSLDETTLFTQAEGVAEDILSGPIKRGDHLTATRQGGALQTDSGVIVTRDAKKLSPRPNRRYVLFLKSRPESADFDIVSGFDISGQGVLPLELDSATMPFSEMKITAFMTALRNAAAQAR
jgi:hypothetical protein